MRKEDADLIKAEYSESTSSALVLEFMEKEDMQQNEFVLDFLETHLQTSISDYSLDDTCTLIDDENCCLVRTYWFSKGMNDTFICINPDGRIAGMDPEIPMHLLAQVATELGKLLQE